MVATAHSQTMEVLPLAEEVSRNLQWDIHLQTDFQATSFTNQDLGSMTMIKELGSINSDGVMTVFTYN